MSDTARVPHLFHRHPALAGRLPFRPLGSFPTPVRRLEANGVLPQIHVKQDNLSGERYGGNKVRKLEFLLGRAAAGGHPSLWSLGAIGSHHVLATAFYGQQQGFEVLATLFPQPLTDHVKEDLLVTASHTVELVLAPRPALSPAYAAGQLLRWRTRTGHWPFRVPPGGSDAWGTLGYVDGALELATQVEEGLLAPPDFVYLPVGSCGTAAGLLVGFALAGLGTQVIAVRVVDRVVTNRGAILRLAAATARLLEGSGGPACTVEPDRLTVVHSAFGKGYGHSTPAADRAQALFLQHGVELDPTYTAKAAAGMLRFIEQHGLKGKHHLFWQTLNSRPLAPLIDAGPRQEQARRILERLAAG